MSEIDQSGKPVFVTMRGATKKEFRLWLTVTPAFWPSRINGLLVLSRVAIVGETTR